MHSTFRSIFKKEKGILIGALHFPPLLGYPDFPGWKQTLKNAIADLHALERGGMDAIIIENNYSLPHHPTVFPEEIASMAFLAQQLRLRCTLPMGINVLWNDYRASLALAKIFGYQFIRVPVLVDSVKTGCGVIDAPGWRVFDVRTQIDAESIAVFADVHVKHATLLSTTPIEVSAKKAKQLGADAVIVTGSWTGIAPDLSELNAVRLAVGRFPILTGSGSSAQNIASILSIANGSIVSTSLKVGSAKKGEVNVKHWKQRISPSKVRTFVQAAQQAKHPYSQE